MSQRAPSLVSDTHYCVVGDVTIDATAAIASGVVLQAPSGSRIVVGKDVCLAAGVCIQSRQGVLSIGAGASLGANVLIIGQGTVGAMACISAGSTVINPAIAAEAIIPPDSLIGETPIKAAPNSASTSSFDSSSFATFNGFTGGFSQPTPFAAQASTAQTNTFVTPELPTLSANPWVDPSANLGESHGTSTNGVQSSYQSSQQLNQPSGFSQNGFSQNGFAQNGFSQSTPTNGSSSLSVQPKNNRVYGRDQVSELISTLFPHRQPLDNNQNNFHN